jgi:hypothetical protein
VAVLFEVTNTWKGVNETQVRVYTATNSASCGFNFNLGDEYLVYASGDKSRLITGLCDRTTHISKAAKDLDVLGEGLQPTVEGRDQEDYIERDERQKQEEQNGFFLVWLIVGGFFIGTLYLIRYWMKLSKNKQSN